MTSGVLKRSYTDTQEKGEDFYILSQGLTQATYGFLH